MDRAEDLAHLLVHTQPAATALVPEIELRLLRADSSLWRAFSDDPEEARSIPRPYWAFAWSGGQALARFVLDRPELVAGRRVLDFACGCGISAVAAARAGAREVLAADVDPMAAVATRFNAERNGCAVETTTDDLLYAPSAGFEVVLAGDIWYDARLARHALAWLRALAAEGIPVLTADPGRYFTPGHAIEQIAEYEARSVPDLEQPTLQKVFVYRLPPSR